MRTVQTRLAQRHAIAGMTVSQVSKWKTNKSTWKFYALPYSGIFKLHTPPKHIIKEREITTPSHVDVIRVRLIKYPSNLW